MNDKMGIMSDIDGGPERPSVAGGFDRDAWCQRPPRTGLIEEVVYGEWVDGLVFIRHTDAVELAAFRQALNGAQTWGDLWATVSRRRWDEILEKIDNGDRRSFWEFYFDYLNDEFEGGSPPTAETMRERYKEELGIGERWPFAEDPFEADQIFGYGDGDWPEWPAQDMIFWVPGSIQRSLGHLQSSSHNGDFLWFDPSRETEVVAAMAGESYRCERNDDLIAAAHRG